jgi:hypothetical protein
LAAKGANETAVTVFDCNCGKKKRPLKRRTFFKDIKKSKTGSLSGRCPDTPQVFEKT